METTIIVALIMAIFAVIANILRAIETPYFRVFHIIVSMVSFYFASVYVLTLIGALPLETFGADFLRPGMIVLMACLGTFALAYRRRR